MSRMPCWLNEPLPFVQDSVNRKLSLQTVVDFAVKHKSQWMFITPHDIRSASRCFGTDE